MTTVDRTLARQAPARAVGCVDACRGLGEELGVSNLSNIILSLAQFELGRELVG